MKVLCVSLQKATAVRRDYDGREWRGNELAHGDVRCAYGWNRSITAFLWIPTGSGGFGHVSSHSR